MEPELRRPVTRPSEELVLIGAPIALRDGSRVRIRRLRHSDSELLLLRNPARPNAAEVAVTVVDDC